MSTQSKFIVHITAEGERWDLLAFRYYGDAAQYAPIIRANPRVAIEPVFEAGIRIDIPVLVESTIVTSDLPPWRLKAAEV